MLPCWYSGIEAVDLDPEVHDICLIGIYTGIRRGEIVSLDQEQVGMERHIFRVEETKSG